MRVISAPADASGRMDLEALPTLDRSSTVLVTYMWANNKTGAVQSVSETSTLAGKARAPPHIDAVQAAGHVPIDFHASGAAAMAIPVHKLGGLYSIGTLLVRRDITLCPRNNGSGQERGLWSGTQDVTSAADMAAGSRTAISEMQAEHDRVENLTRQLTHAIAGIERTIVHTTQPASTGYVYAGFPGTGADSLIIFLDTAGTNHSIGSARNAGANRLSHVLLAMGMSEPGTRSATCFTLGWTPTQDDVDVVIAVLSDTVMRVHKAGMAQLLTLRPRKVLAIHSYRRGPLRERPTIVR